jgi:hypothetical protein
MVAAAVGAGGIEIDPVQVPTLAINDRTFDQEDPTSSVVLHAPPAGLRFCWAPIRCDQLTASLLDKKATTGKPYPYASGKSSDRRSENRSFIPSR